MIVSTLDQPVQPRTMTAMVALFATTIIDAVEAEVSTSTTAPRQAWIVRVWQNLDRLKKTRTATEDARQLSSAHPRDRIAWETLRTACDNLQEVIAVKVHAHFEEYLAESERLIAKNDQRGLYTRLDVCRKVGEENMPETSRLVDTRMARCHGTKPASS